MPALTLHNSDLVVEVRPDEGGRIASLRCRRSGLEFLTQAQKPACAPLPPSLDRLFRDGPCAGIEDCLPTVGPSGAETQGGPVPDHGDLWQLPWSVLGSPDPEHLHLVANGFSRPLRVGKHLTLQGPTLGITYDVQNHGPSPVDLLYACHPLFSVDPGDRIMLPSPVTTLHLNYSRAARLGPPGSSVPWPRPLSAPPLDLVAEASATTADMLYTDRLSPTNSPPAGPLLSSPAVACCGLYRQSARQGILVSFDPADLPHLGLWLCYGGWPDLPGYSAQFAVALEPTTAPVNTLAEAQRRDLALPLAPGQSRSWTIAFTLTAPGTSLEQLRQTIG